MGRTGTTLTPPSPNVTSPSPAERDRVPPILADNFDLSPRPWIFIFIPLPLLRPSWQRLLILSRSQRSERKIGVQFL
jgi:hypothetical protein